MICHPQSLAAPCANCGALRGIVAGAEAMKNDSESGVDLLTNFQLLQFV